MKIQVLASTAILTLLVSGVASAGTLSINNNSTDAIAVGGTISAAGPWGTAKASGATALAGSVSVDACDCYDTVSINNTSNGAIAVGDAAAGSVMVSGSAGL